jgi:hypothetical protein
MALEAVKTKKKETNIAIEFLGSSEPGMKIESLFI